MTTDMSYFKELAAEIAAHGGVDLDNPEAVKEAVKAAHERRQAFIQEMLDNRTERAQMARNVLTAQVYAGAIARGTAERALDHCEQIADERMRRAVWG